MARVHVTRTLPFEAVRLLDERHELVPTIEQAEGILCLLTDRFGVEEMARAPHLRVISNYAVGADNIDVAEARRRGIAVGVTPGVLTESTADLAFALILAAARRLPEAAQDARQGRWQTWEPAGWLGLELNGATLALIGPGRIGRAVAKRAEAFGMNVITVGRDDDLHEALSQADVVSLHAPLTHHTRGMIGPNELERMKPTAILVNTARGGLVQTDALTKALSDNEIAGAALDVTDPEPLPPDHPLYDRENALIVPHIGSATHATRERMAELAVENLLAGLEGRDLPHPAPG